MAISQDAGAREMDRADELALYRDRFHIPRRPRGAEAVYLCGNSLGLEPKSARSYIERELLAWERLGVEGHFQGPDAWMPYHKLLTDQTARLVGARPGEVVVMNSLTVNMHLMMVSFYRPSPTRYRIVIEANAFPSDQYAVQSQAHFHGYDPAAAIVELKPRPGEHTLATEDIEAFLAREGNSVSLIMLGGVNYYTGQLFDMKSITRAAQAMGCAVGFNLAHAAGNTVLSLHDWNVDFAVWCSYKYLNAGPGSTAGCFVHERHVHDRALPRFAGWWGSNEATRFAMGPNFDPIGGAEGWQLSNPAILPMAALRASMEIFDEVGMTRLRAKSVRLTGYLESFLRAADSPAFSIITPFEPEARGAQLSLHIPRHGRRVFENLLAAGFICDWREPDVIRVAPVPLYNTFQDVHRFATAFLEAIGAS
jgi:kynureninase